MKEIAKQKEKEEEIKFEEKLKRQLMENQKRAELIKNNEFKNNKYFLILLIKTVMIIIIIIIILM